MTSTILVVTSVHWPDDTRIRERLIRTLAEEFEVVYAARVPGPTDDAGLRYLPLHGGRLRRNVQAIVRSLTTNWEILVVHDPELLPCAVLARVVRRRPVVFDVHEDIPASAHTRAWVPNWARAPLAKVMGLLLRVVEPLLTITLAEPGYARLFAKPHPTFANFPDTDRYPEPGADSDGPVVYVGDVTAERGADLAVAACSGLGVPLRLVGRITPDTSARLMAIAGPGADLAILGLVPNREAIAGLQTASVGLAPLRDLPNYRHSQPTKVLEYLAMGLPVVASDLPGTRELVDGLEAVVLVPPGDVEALGAGIEQARRPEMASRARAQAASVRSGFRWPGKDVLRFYRSLL